MALMLNSGFTVIYYGILQAQPPKKVRDNFRIIYNGASIGIGNDNGSYVFLRKDM